VRLLVPRFAVPGSTSAAASGCRTVKPRSVRRCFTTKRLSGF
jgi:hypothetical protein